MKSDMLLQELQKFKEVSAGKRLRERITMEVDNLPASKRELYIPINTLRFAFATLILLLFTSFGYGLVASTQKSAPGNPLYPLKTAVDKLPLFGISAKISPKLAPSNTPTPTAPAGGSPTSTTTAGPTISHDKKEKEVHGAETGPNLTISSQEITKHQNFWEWLFSKHQINSDSTHKGHSHDF